MNLDDIIQNYINDGYDVIDAESKTAQDIVLLKISKSNFKDHITIKGGVVMHSLSNMVRRATRDLDLDFIKYSLADERIKDFIKKLNSVNDGIKVEIIGDIKELHQQSYDGKRVFIRLTDNHNKTINTKMDIGVHKLFDIEQDNYYFNLDALGSNISLFVNSPEQIFTEKLKSLLKLGFRSTRYKDLFDFYYLINNKKLDKIELLNCFNILIFEDVNMRENNINDIISRLRKTLSSSIYRNNLNNPKYNWLDISIDDAINCVLKYISDLDLVTV